MSETPPRYDVESDRPEQPPQLSIQSLDTKLDLLIEQVGRLTEVLTTGLSDIKALVERQAQTTEAQSQSITALVQLANRQAAAIERLLDGRG